MKVLGFLQRLGRSLQLTIAVLPVAALLLRFGQADLLDWPWMLAAGQVIFQQLPLLFAMSVATSWSASSAGAAAIAGSIAYFVLTASLQAIDPSIQLGALGGICMGLLAGVAYNRWHDLTLPNFLSFFSGKRFVPIVSGLLALLSVPLFLLVWPPLQQALTSVNAWLVAQQSLGAFLYGICNRLLIPTGLHQILNTFAWFQSGTFVDPNGVVHQGEIARFFAGDTTAGMFMSGFFPIFMFGLPAAALAMYFTVPRAERGKSAGLLLSVALTSFLTGITEPFEFLFMFIAPMLYGLHALLTGAMLAAATLLNIHAGFTFSAGAIDFALMSFLPAASRNVWWLLFPLGAIAGILYFWIFRWAIQRFNLPTPGRTANHCTHAMLQPQEEAAAFIAALCKRVPSNN